MKRKVVKLGPSTLVMSLPSKWNKKYDIKAGNEINVEEKGNSLLVYSGKRHIIAKETVDLSVVDAMFKRIVASKYLKGSDEIRIKFDSLEKSRIVQKRVDEMIGMEIVEQSKDHLLIKSMGKVSDDSFATILRRVLYLLYSISEESLTAIGRKEKKLEYLKDMEHNVNRFTDYCFRLLAKNTEFETQKVAVYYCVIFLLEELGDAYKALITYIAKEKINLTKKQIDIYSDIVSLHKRLNGVFLKYDLSDIVVIAKMRDSIILGIEKGVRKTKSVQEALLLKYFGDIANLLVKASGELLFLN